MLHSPQSFGWTSEIYIKYGILSSFGNYERKFPSDFSIGYGKYKNMNLKDFSIPNLYSQREGNITPKTLIDIPENEYVVFPKAEAIDALIKEGEIILAIQITTIKNISKLKNKLLNFVDYCKDVAAKSQLNGDSFEIIPWFISIEAVELDFLQNEYNGLISTKELWSK